VYPIKNKNKSIVSVPCHPAKVTQRATLAKMHSQLTQGWFLENLHFSKLESKQNFLQRVKPELAQITGV